MFERFPQEITFSYFFLPFPLFEKEKRLVRELVGEALRAQLDAVANKCSRTINLFFSFSNEKERHLRNDNKIFFFFVIVGLSPIRRSLKRKMKTVIPQMLSLDILDFLSLFY